MISHRPLHSPHVKPGHDEQDDEPCLGIESGSRYEASCEAKEEISVEPPAVDVGPRGSDDHDDSTDDAYDSSWGMSSSWRRMDLTVYSGVDLVDRIGEREEVRP